MADPEAQQVDSSGPKGLHIVWFQFGDGMKTLLLLTMILISASHANAADRSEHYVQFALPSAPPTAFETKRGITRIRDKDLTSFGGLLSIPAGAQNAPAIVLVHTCHGTSYYQPWLDRFHSQGYVTLSFSRCDTRTGEPDDVQHSTFDWKRGALVAFGALEYLSSRKEVDPSRIAILDGLVPPWWPWLRPTWKASRSSSINNSEQPSPSIPFAPLPEGHIVRPS